jgi:hypothetical protein
VRELRLTEDRRRRHRQREDRADPRRDARTAANRRAGHSIDAQRARL